MAKEIEHSSSHCQSHIISQHLTPCFVGYHHILQCPSQDEQTVGHKDVHCTAESPSIDNERGFLCDIVSDAGLRLDDEDSSDLEHSDCQGK